MSASRRVAQLIAVMVLAALVVGCVDVDDEPLPPLRGLEDDASYDPMGAGDDIDLAAPAEDGSDPADAEGFEPPPEFPDVPFEELDLPPDEPPPPIEESTRQPGGAPATPERPSEPRRGPPPPPPSEPLDVGALGSVGDYCQLWQTYGGYGAVLDQALVAGPPDRTAAALTFGVALYQRAGDLAPGDRRSDFHQLAGVLGGLDSLLGDFGHDFGAFLSAAEDDPQLLSELQSIEAPAEHLVPRIDDHIFATCGVSIA